MVRNCRRHPSPDDPLQFALVAVADASSPPDAVAECAHPAAVIGVMAHEFAHYEGARGPEGTRRTVTYYGPVIGGMPIQAWHCPSCGVLKLTHPDGRTEERRLFPGRQAGLISEASAIDVDRQYYGLQPRVSGLSTSPDVLAYLARATPSSAPRRSPRQALNLPALGAATWTVVALLTAIAVALLVAGVAATYDWTTPDYLGWLAGGIAAIFGVAMVILVAGATWRQFGPPVPLSPPLVVRERGAAHFDGATYAVVMLLAISVIGLLAVGILAAYDWTTAGIETPVFTVTIGAAVLAALVLIASGIVNHLRRN